MWRKVLPLVAGTGRDPALEKIRIGIIMNWMWENLKQLQPCADKRGLGREWAEMCLLRTPEAARIARNAAAYATSAADSAATSAAAYAAAAAYATSAADSAADSAYAATAAAAYAAAAYAAATEKAFWEKADITALLGKLVTAQV
jgi:hypothetical protein